jgi:hypothetical protein
MGTRRESKYENLGARITEAGDWACPVSVLSVSPAFRLPYTFAIGAEAGAPFAGNDGFMDLNERGRKGLCGFACHCIP